MIWFAIFVAIFVALVYFRVLEFSATMRFNDKEFHYDNID